MTIDIAAIRPGDTVTVTVDPMPSNNRPGFTTAGEVYQPGHSDGLWVGTVALASGFVTITHHEPAKRDWPDGTIAVVTKTSGTTEHPDSTYRAVRLNNFWCKLDGPGGTEHADNIRPLVVIDPAGINLLELQRIAEKAQDSEDMNWGEHDPLAGLRAALAHIGIQIP